MRPIPHIFSAGRGKCRHIPVPGYLVSGIGHPDRWVHCLSGSAHDVAAQAQPGVLPQGGALFGLRDICDCRGGGLTPVVAFLGPAFAGLLSGSFVVETIFQIPGLGRFYVQAAFNRDYTMIMGTVLFFAALILLLNLVVDVVVAWLDPRLRYD